MRASQIEEAVKGVAPYELAYEGEELGLIWGDPRKEVRKVAVTWRPTVTVLRECLQRAIDLLIAHEPLLQSKKSSVIPPSQLTYPPNQTREALLKESGLTVIRAHSNWDDAEGGNNDSLARILDINVDIRIPYGRVGSIHSTTLMKYVGFIKEALGCKDVLVVGDKDKKIDRVAVVSGSGNALTEMMEISKQKGADVLVSGDVQDSRARFAAELGLALIDAGGYYTETPGMKNLARVLSENLPELDVIYLDPGPPWWHA